MRKQFLVILTLACFSLLYLNSCKKEKKESTAKIEILATIEKAPEGVDKESINLDGLKVTFLEKRSNKSIESSLNVEKKCNQILDKGSYDITIKGKVGTFSVFGSVMNYSIGKDATIEVKVVVTGGANPELDEPLDEELYKKGLIFKELFFNGGFYDGRMMHPDQYIVIFNNSNRTIYCDGVSIAITAHATPYPNSPFLAYLPNAVFARSIYTIPGSGNEYALAPGEQYVIARNAQNHSAVHEGGASDLSGADFEVYNINTPEPYLASDGQFYTPSDDIDNPDVPNMIISLDGGMFDNLGHPKGFVPLFIFYTPQDMDSFLAQNKTEFELEDGGTKSYYKISSRLILDGIETSQDNYLITKAFPASVDETSKTVPGCHKGYLIKRKELPEDENGIIFLKDTNNSEQDCEVVKGQNSFPKDKRFAFKR